MKTFIDSIKIGIGAYVGMKLAERLIEYVQEKDIISKFK